MVNNCLHIVCQGEGSGLKVELDLNGAHKDPDLLRITICFVYFHEVSV